MFPIYYEANDGAVFAYPGRWHKKPMWKSTLIVPFHFVGDELYPTDPCFTHTIHDPAIYKGKSCKEIRTLATKLHRYELCPTTDGFAYYMNIEPFDGHLSPIVPNLFN